MLPKTKGSPSRIKLHELAPEPAATTENQSLEYPHLYRLRLGDWQVSYAVEHNKLVILVLEGLEPQGQVQEKTGKPSRIKVKNLLEKSATLPPQVNKATRIKLRNLLEDVKPEPTEGGEALKKVKIKLLDLLEKAPVETDQPEEQALEPIQAEDWVPAESEDMVPPDEEPQPRIRLLDQKPPSTKK